MTFAHQINFFRKFYYLSNICLFKLVVTTKFDVFFAFYSLFYGIFSCLPSLFVLLSCSEIIKALKEIFLECPYLISNQHK